MIVSTCYNFVDRDVGDRLPSHWERSGMHELIYKMPVEAVFIIPLVSTCENAELRPWRIMFIIRVGPRHTCMFLPLNVNDQMSCVPHRWSSCVLMY